MEKRVDLERPTFTWKMLLLSSAFLVGMSPLLLYQFYRNYERGAIRRNRAFTTATLTTFEYYSFRGSQYYKVYAAYRVKGVRFTCSGKAVRALTLQQRRSLIGVRLPVIYDSVNPANSALLSSEGFQPVRYEFTRQPELDETVFYQLTHEAKPTLPPARPNCIRRFISTCKRHWMSRLALSRTGVSGFGISISSLMSSCGRC